MSWLIGKFGGLGLKLVAFLVMVGGFLAWLAGMKRKAKQEGVAQEHARQQDAWSQTERRVAEAGAAADALDDDAVRARLRERAAPAAGQSDTVRGG